MVIYSSDHGSTIVDNYAEPVLPAEHTISTDVFDIEVDVDDCWSSNLADMWSSDSDYQRPNIYCWSMVYAFYAALALVLHLEVPSFPVVLLPFIFPQEEIVPKAD